MPDNEDDQPKELQAKDAATASEGGTFMVVYSEDEIAEHPRKYAIGDLMQKKGTGQQIRQHLRNGEDVVVVKRGVPRMAIFPLPSEDNDPSDLKEIKKLQPVAMGDLLTRAPGVFRAAKKHGGVGLYATRKLIGSIEIVSPAW